MSITPAHIEFNNNSLSVKKLSFVVASVMLSALLGACSGNNGSSETTSSDTNGTTGTGTAVTTSTGSTGTGSTGSGSTTGGSTTTGTGTGTSTGSDGSGSTGGSTTGTGTGTGSDGSGSTGGSTTGTGTGTGSDGSGSAGGSTTGTGSDTGTGTGSDGSGSTGGSTTGTGTGTGSDGSGSATSGAGGADFPAYFTKLGEDGAELPADASVWSCILDTKTGLVWEVKTDDGGLRDKDWRYQYDGSGGLSPAGTDYPCVGVYACNPMSYVEALNAYGVCGKTDWRLPTDGEMGGIGERHDSPPHINLAAFPHLNTDLPYCIAKVEPGHYQGIHFGVEVPAGADLGDALRVDMKDYAFQCRTLMVSG